MDYVVFIPALLGAIIFTIVYIYAENENDDYVSKIWCYIIAGLILIGTSFITEKCIEFKKNISTETSTNSFYEDNWY